MLRLCFTYCRIRILTSLHYHGWPRFKIDTRYRSIPQHDSGVFLRVKHACYRLYRLLHLLAARFFHTVVAFQKKSGPGTISTGWIPNKLDSGFQWLESGFHELDSGFQSRGFRIPQAKIAWIPDSGLLYMGRHVLTNFWWAVNQNQVSGFYSTTDRRKTRIYLPHWRNN